MPPLKPAIVADRFATLAPEVLVIRYDTYIACGPAVAGELLSRVSALSLACTTLSERGAGSLGRATRAAWTGGTMNPPRSPRTTRVRIPEDASGRVAVTRARALPALEMWLVGPVRGRRGARVVAHVHSVVPSPLRPLPLRQ